jgi:hypothetical protein
MNLQNLNVVELNDQEAQEIEGGFWGLLLIAVLAIGFGLLCLSDPDRVTVVQ